MVYHVRPFITKYEFSELLYADRVRRMPGTLENIKTCSPRDLNEMFCERPRKEPEKSTSHSPNLFDDSVGEDRFDLFSQYYSPPPFTSPSRLLKRIPREEGKKIPSVISRPSSVAVETPGQPTARRQNVWAIMHRSREGSYFPDLAGVSKDIGPQFSKQESDSLGDIWLATRLGRSQINTWKQRPGRNKSWKRSQCFKATFEENVLSLRSSRRNRSTSKSLRTSAASADLHDCLLTSSTDVPLGAPSVLTKRMRASRKILPPSSGSTKRSISQALSSPKNHRNERRDQKLECQLSDEDLEDNLASQPDVVIGNLEEE